MNDFKPNFKILAAEDPLYEALLYLEASINSVGQDGTKKTGLPINNMKRACKIVMQQDTSEAEEDEEAEECGAGETVLRVSESRLTFPRKICFYIGNIP